MAKWKAIIKEEAHLKRPITSDIQGNDSPSKLEIFKHQKWGWVLDYPIPKEAEAVLTSQELRAIAKLLERKNKVKKHG